jgi:hypothetical protein
MLLPNIPSTARERKIKSNEFAKPRMMNPTMVEIWLIMRRGFLPYLSLNFPIIGAERNWKMEKEEMINPTTKGEAPNARA